jgi:hypothetical protein
MRVASVMAALGLLCLFFIAAGAQNLALPGPVAAPGVPGAPLRAV